MALNPPPMAGEDTTRKIMEAAPKPLIISEAYVEEISKECEAKGIRGPE